MTGPEVAAGHPIPAVPGWTGSAVSAPPGVDTRDPGTQATPPIVKATLVHVSAVVARPSVAGGTGATREATGDVDTRDKWVLGIIDIVQLNDIERML